MTNPSFRGDKCCSDGMHLETQERHMNLDLKISFASKNSPHVIKVVQTETLMFKHCPSEWRRGHTASIANISNTAPAPPHAGQVSNPQATETQGNLPSLISQWRRRARRELSTMNSSQTLAPSHRRTHGPRRRHALTSGCRSRGLTSVQPLGGPAAP